MRLTALCSPTEPSSMLPPWQINRKNQPSFFSTLLPPLSVVAYLYLCVIILYFYSYANVAIKVRNRYMFIIVAISDLCQYQN